MQSSEIANHYEILNVDVQNVNDFHSTYSGNINDTLFVHLGVAATQEVIKIETTAYNNMTFRVPDERGFQPQGECIIGHKLFDAQLCSDLPLDNIVSILSNEGYDVTLSSDPGRFLCNYVYYNSLELQSNQNLAKNSVFIHFPNLEKIPLDNQVQFVNRFIQVTLDLINHPSLEYKCKEEMIELISGTTVI